MKQLSIIFIYLMLSFNFIVSDTSNDLSWVDDYEILVALDNNVKSSLLGVDKNKNGIRDDVEYYVSKKYEYDLFQKHIYLEIAKDIQKVFKLSQNDSSEMHKKLDEKIMRNYTCHHFILNIKNYDNLKEELKNIIRFKDKILNTESRIDAYIKHKDIVSFKFIELTQEQVKNSKQSCLAIYETYHLKK